MSGVPCLQIATIFRRSSSPCSSSWTCGENLSVIHRTGSSSCRVDVLIIPVYKPGKVAVVLSGRQSGKKVVVIQQRDEGTKERPYPHAIVAGVERSVGLISHYTCTAAICPPA